MDITNVIIPKKSIGGACIGESIEKIEAGLSGHYKIKKEQNSFTLDDEVLKRSKEQIAWSGFVQVDKISGIGLSNERYEHHKVEIKNYTLPDGETRTAYIIDSTFTLSTLPDGTIFSIGCNA